MTEVLLLIWMMAQLYGSTVPTLSQFRTARLEWLGEF
jgi:hypothetical protein